jgi:hypothetical protein
MRRIIAIFISILLGVGGAALPASSSVNPNLLQYQGHGPSDGEFSAWTKLVDGGLRMKFYVKYPEVGQKIQFLSQQSGEPYRQIAWQPVTKPDLTENGSYINLQNHVYFIRTVDLKPGKNRFRILLDGRQVGSNISLLLELGR